MITYHETSDMVPANLQAFGSHYRTDVYYKFTMGGAVANGKSIYTINNATSATMTADPIPMTADIAVATTAVDAVKKTAQITATVTAKEALPAGVKLHAVVVETRIDFVKLYGKPAVNGQAYIQNGVRGFVFDSLGKDVPSLAAGATFSSTGTFTLDPTCQNPDSLRVISFLQVEATKKILSVMETKTTLMALTGIRPGVRSFSANGASIKIEWVGAGRFRIWPTSDNMRLMLCDMAGRAVARIGSGEMRFGVPVDFSIPSRSGLYVLRVTRADGSAENVRFSMVN